MEPPKPPGWCSEHGRNPRVHSQGSMMFHGIALAQEGLKALPAFQAIAPVGFVEKKIYGGILRVWVGQWMADDLRPRVGDES